MRTSRLARSPDASDAHTMPKRAGRARRGTEPRFSLWTGGVRTGKVGCVGGSKGEPRTADAGSPTVVLPNGREPGKYEGGMPPSSDSISTGECVALSC